MRKTREPVCRIRVFPALRIHADQFPVDDASTEIHSSAMGKSTNHSFNIIGQSNTK